MKNQILLFFIFFSYYIPVLQATIFVPRSRGTKIAASFSNVSRDRVNATAVPVYAVIDDS